MMLLLNEQLVCTYLMSVVAKGKGRCPLGRTLYQVRFLNVARTKKIAKSATDSLVAPALEDHVSHVSK